MTDFIIRQITHTDAEQYLKLRLSGLQTQPNAFASSYAEEAHFTVDDIKIKLSNKNLAIFGSFDQQDKLIGMAGFSQQEKLKQHHKGILWGVYVDSAYQNRGLGRLLSQQVINYAKSNVKILQTTVVTNNTTALQLYLSLGFKPYGIEPKALYIDNQFYDETLLQLELETI